MIRKKTEHIINKKHSRLTVNHILLVVIAFLIGTQVYLSNIVATSGVILNDMEKKAVAIEDENQKLLAETVDHLSLYQLTIKAKSLGYTEPKLIVDLSGEVHDNLALNR